MLEKALIGRKWYWTWLLFLLLIFGVGFIFYLRQFDDGLGLSGMSRDVPWGIYISQFTFLVGISASTVIVVITYYLHNHKAFGKIVVLGELLSVAALIMCQLFLFINLGQPTRLLNIVLHPTPNSILFWGIVLLFGYMLLNIVISHITLGAENKGMDPPRWIRPLIYISIPWAIGIFTAIAFLYSTLLGRHFWLSAIMVTRFSAAAFASGIALLIILSLIVKKLTRFDPGIDAIQGLGKIVAYAMVANVFFLSLQFITAFYSNIPAHMHSFKYLYIGVEGKAKLVPLMWISTFLAITSLPLLLLTHLRRNETSLAFACLAVYISLLIDIGVGSIVGGFIPNPFEKITEYWPTLSEMLISLGVWALGFLILSGLYKIAVSVKEVTEQ